MSKIYFVKDVITPDDERTGWLGLYRGVYEAVDENNHPIITRQQLVFQSMCIDALEDLARVLNNSVRFQGETK